MTSVCIRPPPPCVCFPWRSVTLNKLPFGNGSLYVAGRLQAIIVLMNQNLPTAQSCRTQSASYIESNFLLKGFLFCLLLNIIYRYKQAQPVKNGEIFSRGFDLTK